MRFLPALVAGPKSSVLPVSDNGAERLAILALTGSDPQSKRDLLQQMAIDPPLVVWAACRAWADEHLEPDSLSVLAEWLGGHIGTVLRWGNLPSEEASNPAKGLDQYAEQVLLDLQTADLAVQMATGQDGLSPERALLFGLLAGARRWLTLGAINPDEPPLECLPRWLSDDSDGRRLLSQATSILEGRLPPDPSIRLEPCRHRAEIGRSQWLKESSPLVALLPLLTAKLARLGQLEAHFQECLEREKLEAMAELAAGAGHEINNPLAIIAGRAQLLMAGETDPERRRELAVVNAQVKRAHEMIADMRLFARPPRPEPKRFDLTSLVDGLVEDLAAQGAERAITVCRSGDAGPLEMEADPIQLEVALRAMGKNSLELIAHNGQIQIDVRADDDLVHIRVVDDGPGLLPEHRRHLFDPFYSARQAGRGLGLGLSKCWRIVTNHGGWIEVESQPGHGAAFTIHLPRRQVEPSAVRVEGSGA